MIRPLKVPPSVYNYTSTSPKVYFTAVNYKLDHYVMSGSRRWLSKLFWPDSATSAETQPVIMPGDDDKSRTRDNNRNVKAIRLLTVIAYVFSVSIAAAMLSLYYVFIWDPVSHQNNSCSSSSVNSSSSSPSPPHHLAVTNCSRFYGGDIRNATAAPADVLRPPLGNCTERMFNFDRFRTARRRKDLA